MTKVLLTGAGGAVGSHFLAYLLDETNWHIVATDSFRHKGYTDRISEVLKSRDKSRVDVMTHDLTVPFSARQAKKLSDVDHILHLASLSDVEDSIQNPVPFIKNNVDITLSVLELARLIDLKSFVMFSTDEVYGPDKEEGHGHPEWDVILPSNPYSASKAAQEAIAISYWRSYGIPVIITNTMNNVSEMQGADKYPVKIQKAISNNDTVQVHVAGDGQIGSRFYIHSRTAAHAVHYILTNTVPYKHQSGQLDRPDRYNVVGEAHLDNLQLAENISKLMGKSLSYERVNFHADRPGHDLHYGLDGSKLTNLGWKAPMSFEDSLKGVIEWQENHPEWIS